MTKKRSVRSCLAVVLLASCFVGTQSGVTSAWTTTSPQGAVSVFGGIGASVGVYANSVAVDSSGNVYTTGYFNGTADFDPSSTTANLVSAGGFEAFVSKFDKSGNYVWAKKISGTASEIGFSVAVDSSGNVYTTGYFSGTVDFDPSASEANLTATAGGSDVFVSKLDSLGNYVWAKRFGGTGYSVAVDSLGNVYTTGQFGGTVDFDPGASEANLTATAGGSDVFVSKLDSSGNYVWAKRFGGTESLNEGYSVAVDSSGNVYTTGYFKGTTDFDPGVGESNLISTTDKRDVFVSKLDSSGNYVWAKRFGTTGYGLGYAVAVDSSGNVYATGEFRGVADFDPGAGESILTATDGGSDVFVSKLDSSGNYVWAKQFRSTSVCFCSDQGSSVAVDSSGNVYTTGYFYVTVDFDPGAGESILTARGAADVFVSKLDASGNFVWAKKFGGTGSDIGKSLVLDSLSNIYTTGYFPGTADFDPSAGELTLTATGAVDGFVSKLDASGNLVMPAPGAPTSVTATGAGNTQSVVSWTTPTSDGGATITLYTVTSNPGGRTCTWTTGAPSCTVTGLTNGTSYTFSVTATSASGTGSTSDPSSSITPSTTPGAPSPPLNRVTATGAANAQSVVSWTAPSSTGGATITSYTVTSSPDSRTCAWTTGALSCTVTGLTNGTSYTFSVTATNASGTGSASDASSLVIPSTTPGVPTSVSATSAEDVKSVVSWTAPSSTGGATITGYTATSSPGSRTCAWTTGALSCTVTGLTNGTSYTFTVTATNASGTGSASDASRSITPTAPQSITFATVGTQLLGKKTVALSATAASSLAVSFTSATPTVCTVSGATVTMLKLGDCTINADQSGGSGWNAAPQVSKTFIILPSPPAGAVGISIANGDPYTNTKKVVLNLVWPEYATAVRISNDGGFAASQTQTRDLTASINWNLDDRVKGIVPKIVYVRFDGAVDNSKQYSDDIILDTTAPTIETLSAAVVSSSVTLSLKATDDITGVDKVEIRNDTKTVTKDYAARVSVPLVDLLLSVSSSGVRKSATTGLEIRVSDNAGNWTGWETVTVAGLTKTPVTTPTVITPKLTTSKSATVKSIAAYARLAVLSTSKVSLKVVSSSSKYCKVSGATLKGLAAGSCKVTVTVTPKKGRATSKTVTLKVSK